MGDTVDFYNPAGSGHALLDMSKILEGIPAVLWDSMVFQGDCVGPEWVVDCPVHHRRRLVVVILCSLSAKEEGAVVATG